MPQCGDAYDRPIDAAFQVDVDGLTVPLTQKETGSVSGKRWKFGRAKIVIDDSFSLQRDPVSELSNDVVIVPIENAIKGGSLHGTHKWDCEIEVIAPNGRSFPVKRSLRFQVISEPAEEKEREPGELKGTLLILCDTKSRRIPSINEM